jgi:RecJ-like exonuclease
MSRTGTCPECKIRGCSLTNGVCDTCQSKRNQVVCKMCQDIMEYCDWCNPNYFRDYCINCKQSKTECKCESKLNKSSIMTNLIDREVVKEMLTKLHRFDIEMHEPLEGYGGSLNHIHNDKSGEYVNFDDIEDLLKDL